MPQGKPRKIDHEIYKQKVDYEKTDYEKNHNEQICGDDSQAEEVSGSSSPTT